MHRELNTQNESHTIESNNNSEKAANQNLVSPAKTHNFIVVNSEADFAAEKRKAKNEQMRNNNLQTNSTPIKGSDSASKPEMSNNLNLSTTSSISSSSTNLTATNSLSNNMDLNLNMSAFEMRKLIASRRNVKADCKKTTMDLRTKYEIIQQM